MTSRRSACKNWILGVLIAVVTLGALVDSGGFRSSGHSEASLREAARFDSAGVDLAKSAGPISIALQDTATAVIASSGVVNNPIKPGVAATFTFKFTTSGAGALAVGDGIVLGWPKEYLVPETIDRNQVSIASSLITNESGAGACTVGISSDTVVPTEVSVDFFGPDRDPEIRLRVPDMSTSEVCPGNQGINNGAEVTIIFRQSAGIRNAEEAADDYEITVTTTADTDEAVFSVPVPWFVELSSPDGGRGSSLTLVGLGFKDGNTVTFWRDANADGVRQGTEAGPTGLCQAESNSSFVATCTFTMNNPPFKPGFFQTGGTCTLPTPVNCNFINAVDSRQNTVDLDLFPSPQARLNLQTYELRGSITASPNSGKPGDTITIQLQDFPDSPITSFNLSGTPIPITPAMTPVNGSANFFIEIPTGTPQGRLELQIANVVSGVRRTTINVSGALLTVSHREVIPNQKLTISGESFTASTTEVCIVEGGITLAGVPLQIDDVGECNAATLANAPNDPATGFTPERGIRISSEGTFTVAVRVEQTDGTIPIALATEGNFELRVVDTQGAQGTIRLTFPRRELSATPPVLRPGDIVTVNGRRFAALNPDGLTVSVDLLYRCGLVSALAMALPDQSGNFEVSLTVPNGCAIPSTNTITASLRATNRDVSTYTVVSDVITHDLANVPRAGGTVTLQFRSSTAGLATVEINGETFSASSTVADDGSWQIIGPPPGTYTISASAPGYLTAMAEILVGEGDIAMPTIELLGGDVNGDGIVNIDDVSGTASNFLQSGPREWEQQ